MIDPWITFSGQGTEPLKARLESLLDFLESMDDAHVQVIARRREDDGTLTTVGDWFVSESMVPRPGEGYRQTIFTWHAPTVLNAVRAFDELFNDACSDQKIDPDHSRSQAAEIIRQRLAEL